MINELSDIERITSAVNTVIGMYGVKEQQGSVSLDGTEESVMYSRWWLEYGGFDDSMWSFRLDVREYIPGDIDNDTTIDPTLRDIIQVEVIDDTTSSTFGFVALSKEGVVFESGIECFEGKNVDILDCESIADELIRTADREYEYTDRLLRGISERMREIYEKAEFSAVIEGEDIEEFQLDFPSEDYQNGTKLDIALYKISNGNLCVYLEVEFNEYYSSEYILVISPDSDLSLQYYADSSEEEFVDITLSGKSVKEFDRLMRCFDFDRSI